MKILIKNGRLVDPASQLDRTGDVAIAAGRIVSLGTVSGEFTPDRVIDATGLVVAPGLVDLSVRLREPGHEHEGMLESEMAAAVAGGVTSMVCPPDTDPPLDEPGLVQMLKFRARNLNQLRLYPLGALTRGLAGEVLTEMAELTEAGCVGFSQADVPLKDTQVLMRALQYASTFGYTVWLRPQDAYLGKGVAASGPVATRLGLPGVPVVAETIALHTIFELMRVTGARVHLCRISSAAGLALVRAAKAEGLPVTCDVSINNLHLTDVDIGYFNAAMRLTPPLRQQRDRDAIRQALADGTIDALTSDHTPVDEDAKTLPFGEAEPGATGLELLLSLALKWGEEQGIGLLRTLGVITNEPVRVLGEAIGSLGSSAGRLVEGGVADLCLFDPEARWVVEPAQLRSQGRHTPFNGYELPGRVRCTVVAGQVAYESGLPGA
ncbi:dihydroorotase [Caldimonas thermodepolymerans]|uniref:Dihydroorotase n=1 Tax=Caldimonas thermodepolymerans TaxID=215580 RepID=A0A2S5T3U9_9BURK|nr:dihydroorotase [Caldimonas thermodepolymerans]PPE69567.1 dihydroorotase [Caldimonas thermodepolymerans]QPC30920.1 dihydroorotase [Caldimonas thermodepolymerans]RDH97073.1 dihydroorotase [Caldimonas thermodepolymerans]TCP09025.1 dihydroorotase [Caldimonas thermodepolymerans]UZG43660.1 dihydroorotase [Caldimonas thermodepolymerans]